MSARRFNVIAVVAIVLAIVVPLGTRYAMAAAKKKKSKRRPVVAAQAQPFIGTGVCLPSASIGTTQLYPTMYGGYVYTPFTLTCNGKAGGTSCTFFIKWGLYQWDPHTNKYELIGMNCEPEFTPCAGTQNLSASEGDLNLLMSGQYLWTVQIYSPTGNDTTNTPSCANPGQLLTSQNYIIIKP